MGPGHEGDAARRDDDPVLLQRMLDASPYLTFLLDAGGCIRWANDAVERLFGYTVDEVLGTQILDHIDSDWDPEALGSVAQAYAAEGLRLPTVFKGIGKDGTTRIYEVWANSQLQDPVLQGLVVCCRRWDERVLLDAAFEALAAGEPLSVTLGLLVEVMACETLEAHGAVLHDVQRGRPGEVVAHPALAPLLAGHHEPHVDTPWARALHSGERQTMAVDDLPEPVRSQAAEGGHRAVWVWPVPTTTESGVEGVVLAWRTEDDAEPDFTRARLLDSLVRLAGLAFERARDLDRLEHAATHDPLTGVANRASFYDALDEALTTEGRPGRVGVLYLDLDGFKPVNDRLGHGAGDEVLVAVARRLRGAVREGDLVARVGGDEFAVLCPQVDDDEELAALAERLVGVAAEPFEVRHEEVQVGASVGASVADPGTTTSDALVDAADRALYRVKRAAKGSWALASDDPAGPPQSEPT